VVSRPYPAGGSLHELELYMIAGQVRGLEPGIYHYRAHVHELEKVPANEATVKQLRNMGAAAAETREPPHILIVISARFERIMWKYPARAYALTLKNAGVLLQTMYLVATAMGLAGCALGSGDSDLSRPALSAAGATSARRTGATGSNVTLGLRLVLTSRSIVPESRGLVLQLEPPTA
jgi:SagB-type dehydrogenase family enzyme